MKVTPTHRFCLLFTPHLLCSCISSICHLCFQNLSPLFRQVFAQKYWSSIWYLLLCPCLSSIRHLETAFCATLQCLAGTWWSLCARRCSSRTWRLSRRPTRCELTAPSSLLTRPSLPFSLESRSLLRKTQCSSSPTIPPLLSGETLTTWVTNMISLIDTLTTWTTWLTNTH